MKVEFSMLKWSLLYSTFFLTGSTIIFYQLGRWAAIGMVLVVMSLIHLLDSTKIEYEYEENEVEELKQNEEEDSILKAKLKKLGSQNAILCVVIFLIGALIVYTELGLLIAVAVSLEVTSVYFHIRYDRTRVIKSEKDIETDKD